MSDQPSLFGDLPEDRRAAPRRVEPPALDARQLALDLALPVALGPEDFFVSPSNADAHALVAGGLRWPEGKLALIGPEGSGKTHLVRVWQARTGAERREARGLGPEPDLPAPGAAVAVEGMEALPRGAEAAMLHLHNHLRETGGLLLVTADRPAARWGVRLPDLQSRMLATLSVAIGAPDDALLVALLAKLLADRGLHAPPEAIEAAVSRMERSHAGALGAAEAIDRLALAEGREVGPALVRRALGGAAAREGAVDSGAAAGR